MEAPTAAPDPTMRIPTMKTRRTITILWVTLFAGGSALTAFAVPDVAQDIARRTAQDAYAGNPYAALLIILVFGVAGILWAGNQIASIVERVRGKGSTEADPAIIGRLDSLDEKVDKIEERNDELWDDMNRRKGAEAGG